MTAPTPQSLEVALARLEERQAATNEKIDDLKDTITNHAGEQDRKLAVLDERVSSLENWKWKLVGIVTGFSAAAGGAGAAIAQALSK